MDNLTVIVDEKTYTFAKGTPLISIAKELNYDTTDVLAAYVNNVLHEMNYKIKRNCELRFIDLNDRAGNRIYQKGLAFLMCYAAYLLFGKDCILKLSHPIDKGISIKTYFELTKEDMLKIEDKMHELASLNLPITRYLSAKKDAKNYFINMLDSKKADTYNYTVERYVNLYKLGDIYDYFYYFLPVNTSCFKKFSLHYIDERNFVLQFPVPNSNNEIPEFKSHKQVEATFNKDYKFSKQLDIFTSSDINKKIAMGKIDDVIKLSETIADNNLYEIARDIYGKKDKIKLVLIAGPSSSGKTTTSKKLSLYLNSFGLNPKPISIDDYFLPRERNPRLPNGEYDFESLKAIDVELFNKHLTSLLNGEEVSLPTFDFITGEPIYKNKTLKLNDNDIIIVEGLHGLNEELTSSIPRNKKYKIYLAPLTDLNIDNHNMVSTTDVRLLRRIVRDNRTRGYNALSTLKQWNDVRDGEEKYVFPYQDEADVVFNTALIYEIGVLKVYAEPLLYEIDESSIYYEEARRLLQFLKMFLTIPTDNIPNDSILREFIGKSYFE